jgi:phospholipid/cholesterol/gamma-HCH transport system substrate-binding protein
VITRLDSLVTALNKGEGTAGKLLQDKQLYDNMNGAVNELRGLLAEIKKDPKKYLNVKVSIFQSAVGSRQSAVGRRPSAFIVWSSP